uniref:Beta-microseminoprotein n=1 Tax=Sphaeramia orbicularis TaxID=375764 RepID=A0A673BTR3_9TELE
QKYFILALLLCALAASAHASCYQKIGKPGMTHCVDDADGTIHEVGSSWRNSKCMDCTCSGCCTTQFPEDCVSVFDPVACKYIVHKKDDNNTLCDIYVSVL